MRLSPNFSRYNMDTVNRLRDAILLRVPSVAGVESAAMASNFPFNPTGIASGPQSTAFEIEGRRVAKGELAPRVNVTGVSAGYFQTVRQPAVSGRVFERYDDTGSLLAATINQTLARHRWPNENPVGKRITFDGGQSWDTIVGVVADAKEYGIDHAVQDEVYLEQKGFANRLVLRTSADPMSLAPAVRAVLRDIDPQLAVDNVNTVEHFEHESMASPRVIAILLGLFAALALAISASGIAAVMALSVTQRTSELGIRLALGASRWSLVYMVMRSGLALAIAGTVVGLAGSLALTRLLTSLLYAISPTDALTFTGVALLFFAVAAAACFVPAHQVTAIDPLVSLRQE
jgi:putative ABC transport system permease protein